MGKIIFRMTAEVIGSPKEYVEKTMKRVFEKLKDDDEVKVISTKEFDSQKMENEKFWSTFSEVEVEVNDFKKVLDVCYDYTPSSLEILEPAGLTLDSDDVGEFLNDFLARLHKYGAVMKKMQAENIYMMKKLKGEIN